MGAPHSLVGGLFRIGVSDRGIFYNFPFIHKLRKEKFKTEGETRDLLPQPKAIRFSLLVPELFLCCLVHRGSTDDRFASDFQWCCLTDHGSPSVMQRVVSVESSSLLLSIEV